MLAMAADQPFRMKLNAQQKRQMTCGARREFQSLDDSVRTASDDLQQRSHPRNTLMVRAIYAKPLPGDYLGE